MNNAVMALVYKVLFRHNYTKHLCKYLGMWLLGYYKILWKCLWKGPFHFAFSSAMRCCCFHWILSMELISNEFLLLYIPATNLFNFLDSNHCNRHAVVSHCDFNFHFPMTYDIENLSLCLFPVSICIFSSMKHLLRSFVNFLTG